MACAASIGAAIQAAKLLVANECAASDDAAFNAAYSETSYHVVTATRASPPARSR